jgi:drug/metabolite transporter (DMT)-like permease
MMTTMAEASLLRVAGTESGAAQSAQSARATVSAGRLRIYGALAFGVVCISLSAIFTKWTHLPGTVSAFYRIGIAELALLPLFAGSVRRSGVRLGRAAWLVALAAGVFFALDLGLWNTALGGTSAASATLLGNDAPIIVGLIACVVLRERLGGVYWLGLVVALLGMGVIVGEDTLAHAGRLGVGDALALVAGGAYALYLVLTQRVRTHLNTVASLWIPGLAAMLILFGFNLAAGHALWGFAPGTWLALIGLALVSQVAGWLAINYALGHVSAAVVSPTLLAQPVLTALIAVPLLGEDLTPRQMLGGLVALAGIYLVNRGALKRS